MKSCENSLCLYLNKFLTNVVKLRCDVAQKLKTRLNQCHNMIILLSFFRPFPLRALYVFLKSLWLKAKKYKKSAI